MTQTRPRGKDKPEQVTADIAYEILLELRSINKKLSEQKPPKAKWIKN